MRCIRCNSPRILRFIDGFGNRRIFCRDCWLSIPENSLKFGVQKNLHEFRTDSYFRVEGHAEDWRDKYQLV
ncbi:MAG: hypothetical protein DRO65_01855 [Candidatus Altiarchaeales archaeon]|nr:MAG: hypothetical protein DRO65_01855 [Candidatus Altiarchaeales archaeon]